MQTDTPKRLRPHGKRYRAVVDLDRDQAVAVEALVAERRSTPSAVIRELVARGLRAGGAA
jgi:hypothetical protein